MRPIATLAPTLRTRALRTPALRAIALLALAAADRPAWAQGAVVPAQGEAALRAAFEGKTITVKLDMPATSQGIDVFPQEPMPVDFRELAQRLKDHGTALRAGQQVMVTKVTVKRTSHVEFQLGGGGYGTFGDWASAPSTPGATAAGESKEERELRERIRTATGDTKKQLERDLAAMRATRERENARAAAETQQARAAQEANLRAKRAESGSRFNIRYKHGLPAEALTPDGVMRALAQYVEFPGAAVASAQPAASTARDSAAPVAPAAGIATLRKGLTLAEAETILGPAVTAAESQEGAMAVAKRTYRRDGMRVAASFVAGVLVDFTISPQ